MFFVCFCAVIQRPRLLLFALLPHTPAALPFTSCHLTWLLGCSLQLCLLVRERGGRKRTVWNCTEPARKHGGDSWQTGGTVCHCVNLCVVLREDDTDSHKHTKVWMRVCACLCIYVCTGRGVKTWSRTSVCASVDLEVLRPCKHLAAVGEGAGEGLLPGVHTDVVDEFIFGFESLPAAHTLVPHADVTEALQPRCYMLRGDVVHQLVHGAESLVADGRRRPPQPLPRRSSVNPFAHQFAFHTGAFGEIQQAVHPSAGTAIRTGGDAGGSRLRRRNDAGSSRVVVSQRRDEAIVPGHYSRPLHAQRGGLPRSFHPL